MTGVDIIGCPARVESDIGGDGRRTRLDFSVNYLYDATGAMVNADKFDWRNDYTLSRWIYDWERSGRIVSARREDNSSIGASVTYRYELDRMELIMERDDGDDGEVDEIARYLYGSDGDLQQVLVQRRDPGTRQMREHSRAIYSYDCWP